jgi:hypothetical protein
MNSPMFQVKSAVDFKLYSQGYHIFLGPTQDIFFKLLESLNSLLKY